MQMFLQKNPTSVEHITEENDEWESFMRNKGKIIRFFSKNMTMK